MVKGLYTAYTGMINQQKRLDVMTNNLANSATSGFKKEGTVTQSFDHMYAIKIRDSSEAYLNRRIGSVSLGAKIGETYRDYSQGAFQVTDNTFDFALDGQGFFGISFTSKAGETSVKYTRDGAFTLTQDGFLVTKDGDFVLNTQGNPIQLSTVAEIKVDTLGQIYEDGVLADRLGVFDFEDYNYLEKYGENLLQPVEGAVMAEAPGRVRQGYLEASNVNVINEMVEMINITRAYETNQKVIQTIDQTLDKVVNQVGKL